jgi:hypothetical protein
MIERSPHLKAFAFSIELLHDMMTAGWHVGADRAIECVKGLPRGAKFEYVHPGHDHTIVLVFSHPTWPAIGRTDDVPRGVVEFRLTAQYDPSGVSTEGAAWAAESGRP